MRTPGASTAKGKSRSSRPAAVPATSTALPWNASSGTSPRTTSRNEYWGKAFSPPAGQSSSTSPEGDTGMSHAPISTTPPAQAHAPWASPCTRAPAAARATGSPRSPCWTKSGSTRIRPSSPATARTWPTAAAASASTGSGSMRLGAGGTAAASNRASAVACTAAGGGPPGRGGVAHARELVAEDDVARLLHGLGEEAVVLRLPLERAEREVEADHLGAGLGEPLDERARTRSAARRGARSARCSSRRCRRSRPAGSGCACRAATARSRGAPGRGASSPA